MTRKLRTAVFLLMLASLAGCGSDSPTKSNQQLSWKIVRTPSLPGALVAVSSDRIVALEPGFGVRVSLDAKNWTEVVLKGKFAGIPNHIICVSDVFILWGEISYEPHQEIMLVSRDGFNWREAVNDSRTYGPSFAYCKGRILMGTANGELWESDGPLPTRWKRLPSPISDYINQYDLAASPDYYLAIDSLCRVLKSERGDEWSIIDTIHSWGMWCGAKGRLIRDGNRFLYARGTQLFSSVDGTSWAKIYDTWNECIMGFASHENCIVLVLEDWWGTLTVDGDKTQIKTNSSFAAAVDVLWAHGRFVASGNPVVYSEDAVHWDTLKIDQRPLWAFRNVAWGDDLFLAVGGTSICSSSDGLHWSQLPPPPEGFASVVWNGDQFFAMDYNFRWGDTLRIFSSFDGQSWQQKFAGNRLPGIFGLACAGGTVFTRSALSKYLWSNDGAVWHEDTIPGEQQYLVDVDYINERWVCAGKGLYASGDAQTWSQVLPPAAGQDYMAAIANSGNRLVSISWGGAVYSSPDGLSWQQLTLGGPARVRDLLWFDSTFVAICNGPAIATSKDAIDWETTPLMLNDFMQSLACSETRVVTVGLNGGIVVGQ